MRFCGHFPSPVLIAVCFWAMSNKLLGISGSHKGESDEKTLRPAEPGTNGSLPVVNVVRISSLLEADLGYRAARDIFNSLPRWNDRFTVKIHTHYTKRESGQSVAGVLRLFLQTMEEKNKTFVALLGTDYSAETQTVAQITPIYAMNCISTSGAAFFGDTKAFPLLFRAASVATDLQRLLTGLMESISIEQVSTLAFKELAYLLSIQDFEKYCFNRPGCAVQRAVVLDDSVYVSNDIKRLVAPDSTGQAPVVDYIVSAIGPNMGYAICGAYKATAHWLLQPTFLGLERYDVRDIWRPLDTTGAIVQLNCTLDELRAAYNGSVFVTYGNANYVDDRESVTRPRHDGMTLEQIRRKIRESARNDLVFKNTLPNPFSYFAYDGGFALFTALYRTDQRMEEQRFGGGEGMRLHQLNSKTTPLSLWQDFAHILHDELSSTSFDGVTVLDGAKGRVAFDRSQSRIGGVELIQYQGLKTISLPNGQAKAVDNFVRVGFIASNNKVTIETALLRFRTDDGKAPHVWRQKYNKLHQNDAAGKTDRSIAVGTILIIVFACIAAITAVSVAAAVVWHQKRLKRLRQQQDLAWLLPNSHLVQQNQIWSSSLPQKILASTPTITAASSLFSSSVGLAFDYDIAVFYTKNDMRVHIRRLTGDTLPLNATLSLTTAVANAAEFNKRFEPAVAMHRLKHENVNVFVGICLDYLPASDHLNLLITDVATPVAVFQYQEKNTLRRTLQHNDDWSVDTELKYCFIADCVRGLRAIHEAGIVHGFLHTGNVMLDGKLTCKVTDYGLAKFGRDHDELEPVSSDVAYNEFSFSQKFDEKLAFRSPEQLRKGFYGSDMAKSDIYSLGIVLIEILTRQPPRFATITEPATPLTAKQVLDSRILNNENEIVPLFNSSDVNTNLRTFIFMCASESPASRPSSVNHVYKSLMQLPEFALLVSVVESLVLRLQRYASDLELVVTERTHALFEEARRSEQLLLQILPASVAAELKSGRQVQPEYFERVSVYFSDVVDFANSIGARLAPTQVVDLLNSLYMAFDGVLEKYNVYKVETIGDAYMVASGVPLRNEHKHADELCRFSLAILETIQSLPLLHNNKAMNSLLNSAAVQLRIGLHCGPCMAGVIGIRLPRYCLFGDTINTASRMQSTGQQNRIHCSNAMRTFTELHFPNKYIWQNRGEITVKGLGVVTTHWLSEHII